MNDHEIVVIGAGVFGSWTAWGLRRAGKSVLLLDAWGPGNSRSSSGGESRIIRMGYGGDEIYTQMAVRSLALWEDVIGRSGQPLFHRTGVLWMARQDDPYSEATAQTLNKAGVEMERVPSSELARRYPQMQLPDPNTYGIFEPVSGALMGRRALASVVDDAVRSGIEYCTEGIEAVFGSGRRASVRTLGGKLLTARVFVIACGPWLPKLFPDLLGDRIYPTRQEVFFFGPPAGDDRFGPPNLPVWIDFTHPRGPYGFPDLEGRGIKLAFDRHGPPFDPDSTDRAVRGESVAEAHSFVAQRFPALRGAPMTESRVCQYENTSNGDFLIDRHPDFDNVWLVGGGSGHGFKHGPAVGEYVTSRILQGGPVDYRFSLASKEREQRRTVY